MKRLSAAVLLVLAACASSDAGEGWTATTNAQRVPWENNTTAWLISCSRADQAGCYQRAAAVCPSGFTRLAEGGGMGATVTVTVACKS